MLGCYKRVAVAAGVVGVPFGAVLSVAASHSKKKQVALDEALVVDQTGHYKHRNEDDVRQLDDGSYVKHTDIYIFSKGERRDSKKNNQEDCDKGKDCKSGICVEWYDEPAWVKHEEKQCVGTLLGAWTRDDISAKTHQDCTGLARSHDKWCNSILYADCDTTRYCLRKNWEPDSEGKIQGQYQRYCRPNFTDFPDRKICKLDNGEKCEHGWQCLTGQCSNTTGNCWGEPEYNFTGDYCDQLRHCSGKLTCDNDKLMCG